MIISFLKCFDCQMTEKFGKNWEKFYEHDFDY